MIAIKIIKFLTNKLKTNCYDSKVGGQFMAITLKGHIIVVSYILMQCHDIKIAQHILLANNNIFINGRVSFEKWVKVCNSRHIYIIYIQIFLFFDGSDNIYSN